MLLTVVKFMTGVFLELEIRKSTEALVGVTFMLGRHITGIEKEPDYRNKLAYRRTRTSEHIRDLGIVELTDKPRAMQSYLDVEAS